MTAQVVVCRVAGKTPAPDVAVADTRLMHVSAHKTSSVSTVAIQDISAKCVCPTVRMLSHVHVHVGRYNQSMLLGMSVIQPVALKSAGCSVNRMPSQDTLIQLIIQLIIL